MEPQQYDTLLSEVSDGNKKPWTCYKCGYPGQWARDCSGEAQSKISNLQDVANSYRMSTAKSKAHKAQNQFIIS